uniref:Protein kinase domain-containing protein n=1 Tax=viral metagenome TaxID=1070528 RepID=A0A6C0IGF0_9ZZZZ
MDINVKLLEKEININDTSEENYKSEENEENEENRKKDRNYICLYDFYCLNNIKISKKIKQNLYFTKYYDVFTEYSTLKVGQLSQKILDYYDILDTENSQKHILLHYNGNKLITFNTFLFNLPNPALIVSQIIESYEHLLNSFLKLQENNICYFNFSLKNIVFDINHKPILKNFDLSLIKEELNYSYLVKILDKISDFTYKPLEIHVIFYLIKNDENTLSYNSIELISRNFVDNMSILTLFSKNYKDSYFLNCIEFLKKYINKPIINIIEDILDYCDTWDNYSLSILYLHLFGNMTRVFTLKDNFISKMTIMLTKNVCPDPAKRQSIEKTKKEYELLYTQFTDWNFVKQITNEKIKILFDILKK